MNIQSLAQYSSTKTSFTSLAGAASNQDRNQAQAIRAQIQAQRLSLQWNAYQPQSASHNELNLMPAQAFPTASHHYHSFRAPALLTSPTWGASNALRQMFAEQPAQEQVEEAAPQEVAAPAGPERQVARGGRGKDKIRQKGGKGRQIQNARGGRGKDKIRQKGGKGRDVQRARGGKGADKIVQRGGKGADRQNIKGGSGGDTLVARPGKGRDKITLRGGRGNDKGVVRSGAKNITVVGQNGKVLFKRGNGGKTVRVKGVEDFKLVNNKGKVRYSSNQAEKKTALGGRGR